MAINTQKFLPSSKGGSLAKINKTSIKSSSPVSLSSNSINNIQIIKVSVVKIDSILKGTLAAEKKKLSESKKQDSSKRREKIEEKLETKPKAESGKIKMPSLPRMGFLDWVKNFIGNVILGYFAVRLVDHLPKIIPIIKFLGKATDFVLDVGGKLLDGLVTFVDWGYKAYDATRGFVKNLFGKDGVKQFDQLSGLLNQFLNLAIIAGMATAGAGKFGARPRPGIGGRPRPRIGGRPRVTTGVGGEPQFKLPGTAARVTTSGGKRALLSSVRPFLKNLRVPIIGALIDFGLSVALGENPGRAAFRAIGAGILGTIGGGLAGALGLAGGPLAIATAALGAIAGGTLGDMAGGALYDLFFGDKKSSGKSSKYAGGGVTRGGKPQRKVSRTIRKRGRYKRKLAPQKPGEVEATSPGADVGGEEKLFGLFPNPLKFLQSAVDVMNPFKVIQKAGKNLGESDYFGPILAITSKILLGQKPTQQDYKNVGLGINMLVAKGIDDGKLRGGLAAFAEGGFVDPKTLDAIAQGGDISDWVAKSFKDATETNAQKTLREIQENLRLKKADDGRPIQTDRDLDAGADGGSGGLTSGKWGPLLDLISSVESAGGSYDSRYGGTYPGYSKLTIEQADAVQRANYKKWGSAASGKYQFMNIAAQAKYAGLKPTDLFSPENQDKMAIALIEKKRYGRDWLSGKISDPEFARYLSMEWAGLPRGNDNLSFYHGDGRNKAHTTFNNVLNALSKVKKGGYSQREFSQSENIKMGKGYGVGGQKIAGDLGDYMKANRSKVPVTGSIHRHPRHLPWSKSGHSVGSLHYEGRAIDLGGWAPSNRNSGGRDEQAPVIKSIIEWNKRNGYSPVELIHHSPKYRNVGSYREDHNDHVHVAYEKGGMTLGGPHMAMLGEKGKEFVIDADSTSAIEQTFPGFLGALNTAKYEQAINVLRNFASYESGSEQTVVIMNMPTDSTFQDYDELVSSSSVYVGGEESDPFETLYQGG